MGLGDPDYCELHVTIKDYFTKKPYVDSVTGLTTLDMPYEACEYAETMYESQGHQQSTAKVVFPSIVERPDLRGLLQKIKDCARVEIYNFQPDSGDPVFSGYVVPEGISEQDGRLEISVHDSLEPAKWQHVKRYEETSAPVSQLYQRALSQWVDLINDDFSLPLSGTGDLYVRGDGILGVKPGYSGNYNPGTYGGGAQQLVVPRSGDVYLLEGWFTFNHDLTIAAGFSNAVIMQLGLQGVATFERRYSYTDSGAVTYTGSSMLGQTIIIGTGPTAINSNLGTHDRPVGWVGQFIAEPFPARHQLGLLCKFDDKNLTVAVIVDGLTTNVFTWPWTYSSTQLAPTVYMQSDAPLSTVTCSRLRFRKLVPFVRPAARFVPQTSDSVYFMPNNEDGLSFLDLWLQKDNSEVRLIPKPWPQLDLIELDQVGTLGINASARIGYDELAGSAVSTSPSTAETEVGTFATTPPFRFEEGYNFAAVPQRQARSLVHANEVLRLGSGQSDSQSQSDSFSSKEQGDPSRLIAASYPPIEIIVNDDRVGIPGLNQQLGDQEQLTRIDTTPNLQVDIVSSIEDAFRWRSGDSVWTITRSLLNNVEQSMRVMQVSHQAGNPNRQVMLGRLEQDPERLQLMRRAMVMSWLYEQSGSSALTYVYPYVGAIAAGATSTAFIVTLDRLTTGTAVISAGLHWFSLEAPITDLQPIVNGAVANPTHAAGTDSGFIDLTSWFSYVGSYSLAFKNTGAGTHNLQGAFLVLRIKI